MSRATEGSDGRYWRSSKKAKSSNGDGWWYANERGYIEILVGWQSVTITASQLEKFIRMLRRHRRKP